MNGSSLSAPDAEILELFRAGNPRGLGARDLSR